MSFNHRTEHRGALPGAGIERDLVIESNERRPFALLPRSSFAPAKDIQVDWNPDTGLSFRLQRLWWMK